MDLIKLKEQVLEMGKHVGLQVQEETAQSITFHTQLTAKDYFDNSIYFRFVVYTSGTVHLFLTFDEIERTYDNFYLINNFNAEHPWFKAYIVNVNDKDFLELHYATLSLEKEAQVLDTFGFLLNDLLNDNTLKFLNPILHGEVN